MTDEPASRCNVKSLRPRGPPSFWSCGRCRRRPGNRSEVFGDVVVKELIDNALDAAETAGRAPVIDISTRTEGDITFVTVADNGTGIAAATITNVIDFNVLASDKARYRGPARGAQGNALKTLLGIPFALEITEPIVVDTRWLTHACG